jgi:hypothetical protein
MAALVCKVMGVVLAIVAIWGFITGTQVLMFQVNTAHNIVHLLSGVGALACGFAGERQAKTFSLLFGVVYGLVAVLGLLGVKFVVDLLNLNHHDNWLHVAIALVFLVVGLISKPAAGAPRAPGTPAAP